MSATVFISDTEKHIASVLGGKAMFNHKKIIVIGCQDAGKSTFSRKLHNVTQIKLFHLDALYMG